MTTTADKPASVASGDPILASEWNRLRRIVVSILADQQGFASPLKHHLPAAAIMMRLKSSNGDYWTCRRFDGTTEELTDVYVAKPWELRPSETSVGGQTYVYTTDKQRDVNAGAETQVIVPDYVENESVIYAARSSATGVVGPATEPLFWIDLNVAARAWAKKAA